MSKHQGGEEPGSLLQQLGWAKLTAASRDDRVIQEFGAVITVLPYCSLSRVPCACLTATIQVTCCVHVNLADVCDVFPTCALVSMQLEDIQSKLFCKRDGRFANSALDLSGTQLELLQNVIQ